MSGNGSVCDQVESEKSFGRTGPQVYGHACNVHRSPVFDPGRGRGVSAIWGRQAGVIVPRRSG